MTEPDGVTPDADPVGETTATEPIEAAAPSDGDDGTAAATDEKSGRYCTGTLTCSATLAPLTPAMGCSRAP